MIKHNYFKILIILFFMFFILSYLALEDADNNIVEVDNSQEELSDEKKSFDIESKTTQENTSIIDVSTTEPKQGDTIFDEEQNIEYQEYIITHEKDGSSFKVWHIFGWDREIKVFDEDGIEIQSIKIEETVGGLRDPHDLNSDGYTDLVVYMGGTFNEIHDLYIWDNKTHGFIKVIYEGDNMITWFTAYEGYVENFIRGDTPETSIKERLVWEGNKLVIEVNE